jgi:transmembrane sensor
VDEGRDVSKVREIRPGATSAPTEQAARWFGRVRAGLNERDQAAFAAWLEAYPANRGAYEDVTRAWDFLGAASSEPAIVAMRSEALSVTPRRRPSLTVLSAAAALVLTLMSTAGFYAFRLMHPSGQSRVAAAVSTILQTAVGERSAATMGDGSVITLNTNSKVRITLDERSRNVTLLAGQAFFQVAKDKSRPFTVTAGDRQVIALGTQFDVRVQSQGIRVALLEGWVTVRPVPSSTAGGKGGSPVILNPGQLLFADKHTGRATIQSSDVAGLLSWREGRVRFEETPLADAVAEMHRYTATPIRITDPRIAGLRISGAFRVGQSGSFVSSITAVFPVRATSTPSGVELRATR